ncbi:unnamed protein product [Urochloa decumbens]|uniref:DUF1618 domain-containing protein n=1 Tax=Urochloa decumbens TaxID=240449 RepID=A0ABC8Y344_9POAL
MPKRRFDGCGGGRTAKPPRRHLYLVLDDWSIGYSIRKIDLSSDFDSEDSDQLIAAHGPISSNGKRRLPSAVFRFQAQRGLPMYFAAAFDSKIMAMHPVTPGINGMLPWVPESLVPVFDVRMRSVIFGPRQIPDLDDPIYIPVGGRLFALSTGSFQLLYPPPGDDESGSEEEEGWVWSWRQLPEPPFKRKYVTSYTIHPDGRTIFISIKKRRSATTFTFDTAESAMTDDCTWKQHGNWVLPFSGRAYFDSVLDAWVGLSRDPGTVGQLCSCDVVSTSDVDASDDRQCPTVKLCKELFVENPVMRCVGATLLYMGNRSKFCLVECTCIKEDSVDEIKDGSVGGVNEDSVHDMNDDSVGKLNENYEMNDDSGTNDSKLEEQHVSPHSGYFLRLKTFFLMYDKNGDLKTGKHIQVRCYDVPKTVSESIQKHPVAFWM